MGHDYCGSNPGCKTNGHPFPPPCGEENDPCGASGKETAGAASAALPEPDASVSFSWDPLDSSGRSGVAGADFAT